jgi:hypothetical protein
LGEHSSIYLFRFLCCGVLNGLGAAVYALVVFVTVLLSQHFARLVVSSSGDSQGFSGSVTHFLLLLLFACLMAVSGVTCFLLEKDWTTALSVSCSHSCLHCCCRIDRVRSGQLNSFRSILIAHACAQARGKVPLYALLGVSLCFALVLFAYDLLACLPRLVDSAGVNACCGLLRTRRRVLLAVLHACDAACG